jgi:D-cysteine desulfhydrase
LPGGAALPKPPPAQRAGEEPADEEPQHDASDRRSSPPLRPHHPVLARAGRSPQLSRMTDASPDLALFRVAPQLQQSLPRIRLGAFPTAVDEVEVGGRRILVKRDDVCASGYAGNKLRKLEFLLAEARARGAQRVITAGAAGSHHAFATAWHGTRLGFAVTLVLFPQRLTAHVRRMLLLMHATGAELRWVRRMEAVPWGLWRARREHRAATPLVVPPGGSSPVGTLGYVNAALELAEQVRAGVPRPDRIHVAAGTLGTTAGLAIGLAWAGLDVPVAATRITSRLVTNQRALAGLVHDTVKLLGAAGAAPPDAAAALRLVELRHDQIGTGYGHATAAATAATELFAATGLTLDDTYTAKAAAGLLADGDAALPLFWQTLSGVHPDALDPALASAGLPAPIAAYLASADAG